jgi:alkylation response protein AidB-like acyl-CoA dehydrogenase
LAVATTFSEQTDEQRAITEMVRQFVDEQVLPIAEEHAHADSFPEAGFRDRRAAKGAAPGSGPRWGYARATTRYNPRHPNGL